jgi:parvulin-like peptidyl-prolyl isomerase
VKDYSDEPGAGARGGDLGKFAKGSMVPEFQAGLEKIKVGEISDIVETPFGFHVILRTQ